MAVKRIVTNISTADIETVQKFYADLLDLNVVMNQGWIVTLATGESAPVQLSIASEGGAGTAVPDISIEVDNLEAIYEHAKAAGYPIEYPLTNGPWGLRRFYVRDPAGTLLNILAHSA